MHGEPVTSAGESTHDDRTEFEGLDNRSRAAPAPAPTRIGLEYGSAPLAWRLGVPIALVLLVFLAFMPALTAGFVNWDDDDLLQLHSRYRPVNTTSLLWMFTTSYAGHFQPLTWMTYAWDHALWNDEAFGYHLTNVSLHALSAVAFYLVTRMLLCAGLASTNGPRSRPIVLSAAFAAIVFAVHPLRAESVAWIAERRDVLSGFFYVAAVGLYVAYVRGGPNALGDPPAVPRSKSGRWAYLAAVLCCTISLLAKASAVMLPLVLLVLDAYPLRRFSRGSGVSPYRLRPILIDKIPFLLLAVAAGVRAVVAQGDGGALRSLVEHDIPARLAQACYGLAFYLQKTIWPAQLGPLYELPLRTELFGPVLWISAIVVVFVAIAAVRLRRRGPALSVALGVYVVQLLPVLGFAQSGPQMVADRYSYLSCLGLAVAVAAMLHRQVYLALSSGPGSRRQVLALSAGCVIAALFHATFAQADVWQTPLTLWRRGVQVSPGSAIANVNYADALVLYANPELAVAYYGRGLAIEPRDAIAAGHLARTLERLGDKYKAVFAYARALRIDPDRSADYVRLARLLSDRGDAAKAKRLLLLRARRAPGDLKVIGALADLLSTHPDGAVRDGEEAVRWARQVCESNGGRDGMSLLTLATALAEAGRFAQSVEVAEQALSIAREGKNPRLTRELERRLSAFQNGKAYHYGD